MNHTKQQTKANQQKRLKESVELIRKITTIFHTASMNLEHIANKDPKKKKYYTNQNIMELRSWEFDDLPIENYLVKHNWDIKEAILDDASEHLEKLEKEEIDREINYWINEFDLN